VPTPSAREREVSDAYYRHFGVQGESTITHRFTPHIPEEDARSIRSHFASLTRDNPPGTMEHQAILPDGSFRYHQWNDRARVKKINGK